jgi:hypothetical protein
LDYDRRAAALQETLGRGTAAWFEYVQTFKVDVAPGAPDQQDQPHFISESELERGINAWRQRLLALLDPALSISAADLATRNPVPAAIADLYGGADNFIAAPLFWEGPGGSKLSMDPVLHKKLCATSTDPPDQASCSPAVHQHQQQQDPSAAAGVQQASLPVNGSSAFNSPAGHQQQHPSAAAGVQQFNLPATGVGASTIKGPLAGGSYQAPLGGGGGGGGYQQQQRQQPSPSAAAAAAATGHKALPKHIEAETTTWMQRLALHMIPAGPQEEPPYIAYNTLKNQVPIPPCLINYFGSTQAVLQSCTHLGLY